MVFGLELELALDLELDLDLNLDLELELLFKHLKGHYLPATHYHPYAQPLATSHQPIHPPTLEREG